jgi:hypothetical protein
MYGLQTNSPLHFLNKTKPHLSICRMRSYSAAIVLATTSGEYMDTIRWRARRPLAAATSGSDITCSEHVHSQWRSVWDSCQATSGDVRKASCYRIAWSAAHGTASKDYCQDKLMGSS